MGCDCLHNSGTGAAERIRNIGIVAHIDAGKTTLTERILYVTDSIRRMGDVQDGTTVTDWMEQERERGISIASASVHCSWRGCRINVVDTPGHIDFTAEVERSLCVMDGVIAVFCGVKGVQAQSESVWRRAERYRLSAIAFVNKMDREGADAMRVVSQIEERFGVKALPVVYPVRSGGVFRSVLDLTSEWGPEVLSELDSEEQQVEAQCLRERLVESLTEVDDRVLEAYLAGREPGQAELRRALRKATVSRRRVPVLFGSSLNNIGVKSLLDAVCLYMPSPLERKGIPAADIDSETTAALLFRVTESPDGDGRLAHARILSGRVFPGQLLTNQRSARKETVAAVCRMQAQAMETIPQAEAGDIVALKGSWQQVRTGDILADAPLAPGKGRRMRFPQPVMSVVFSSSESGTRLGSALKALCREDPTLRMHGTASPDAWAVSGMGELHMEIIHDRLKSDYGVEARKSAPRVEYRATIREGVRRKEVFEKRFPTGGVTAAVELEIAPLERGLGFRLEDAAVSAVLGDALRRQLTDGMMGVVNGETGGFPLTDMKVTILGASADGSEGALGPGLAMAARMALENGLTEAGVVELEPVMMLEIRTPGATSGNVIADLKSRHGEVDQVEPDASGMTRIVAKAPLAELFGYASSLRSLSAGRGEVVAEPNGYCEKGTLC